MSYIIKMRKNNTGEVMDILEDGEWYWTDPEYGEQDSLHWWAEGNMECDCNRQMIWDRAHGIAEDIIMDKRSHPCGDEAYTVIEVILHDGRKIKIDERD